MVKLRSIERTVGDAAIDDLRARVRFNTKTGQIWLHEDRMLLVHAEALAFLRNELIESLGMARTRGLFTRMGYAAGVRDAEVVRMRGQKENDKESFMTGPRLHALEGVVKVTPITLDIDRLGGKFYGEFIWENSWEGQWHRHCYGTRDEPVCWSQIGYACGYTSTFMGRPILYKEIECVGMGHNNCRLIGKPLEEWKDVGEFAYIFDRESIAEQLIDLQSQVVRLHSSIGDNKELPIDMVGNSPAFRAAYDLLMQAANSQITVLLLGETGVGKEVFARTLHERSARRDASFVAINCAAIPPDLVESELFGVEKGAYTGAQVARPGRFERANGGTLFLDEIGDLPLAAQAKLLRVLQEGEIERLGDQKIRKVNVRVVAATNIDLRLLVKKGKFRSDLYYRLNALEIRIPSLRERKEDISPLANRFLEKYSAIHGKRLRGFTEKAKRALGGYAWPGNIRELQNVIERGVILAPNGTRIEVSNMLLACGDGRAQEVGLDCNGNIDLDCSETWKDLCETVFGGGMTLDRVEGLLIETAVGKARGNLSRAARLLGLTRPRLAYRLGRLRECDISEPSGDAGP